MRKSYDVTINFSSWVTIPVWADDEDDAYERAVFELEKQEWKDDIRRHLVEDSHSIFEDVEYTRDAHS